VIFRHFTQQCVRQHLTQHERVQKSSRILANVSIRDEAGREIDGDELVDRIMGKKKITEDLRAV
jgi:hypothetical protein